MGYANDMTDIRAYFRSKYNSGLIEALTMDQPIINATNPNHIVDYHLVITAITHWGCLDQVLQPEVARLCADFSFSERHEITYSLDTPTPSYSWSIHTPYNLTAEHKVRMVWRISSPPRKRKQKRRRYPMSFRKRFIP